MDWLTQFFSFNNKLPHPNWELIYQYIDDSLSHLDPHTLWPEITNNWLSSLSNCLADDYNKVESENFVLLSQENSAYTTTFLAFLEHSRTQLLKTLHGIAHDQGYGKHVVIMFDENNTYYDYITNFGPEEGTYGLSAGMYINYGYGHFVFPHQEMDQAMPIAAHEMTHALLNHLPIPVWLNEGLAVNMERSICNIPPPRLNRAAFERHLAYWQQKEIQEFWCGNSFLRADEGQELSYDLAQVLVNNLSSDYEAFVAFTNKANWEDAGEQAIEEVFDIGLGDMLHNFIGDGDWSPQPEVWKNRLSTTNS